MSSLKQTPSQTVGPYFAYGLCPQQYDFDFKSLFTETLADPSAPSQHIIVMGNVYDGSGAPVVDAMLEFLQPDADGVYATEAGGAFRGFARVGTGTDPAQRFVLRTVKPGPAGPGRAPAIDVIVHMRGMLLHAYTRIYFDDEAAANEGDAILGAVEPQRRQTLIARRQAGNAAVYVFDIHLQGPAETVFFDL